MGCDGGTIPTRGELVRTKKKPEQVSKEVDLLVKWRHCALSQEPLRTPIVACELGCLFNKESIIEFLLDKNGVKTDSKFEYIKGLKDVKELQLTANPAYNASNDTAIAGEDRIVSKFICPVTGLEMNGRYRFCYLLKCGCVFAERALNEIKDGICLKCGKTYASDDIIPLNGTEDDTNRLHIQMEQRRLLAKEIKKSKREKSRSAAATVTSEDDPRASTASSGDCLADSLPAKRAKLSTADDTATPEAAAKFSIPAPKLSDKLQTAASKSSASLSLPKATSLVNGEKQKRPQSIQDDPNATEAYKSLFSSHKSAKNQPKAHWVTHNPLYY